MRRIILSVAACLSAAVASLLFYHSFVSWIPHLYGLSVALYAAAAGCMAALFAEKKALLRGLSVAGLFAAVFFGLMFLLNNIVLSDGSMPEIAGAVMAVLTLAFFITFYCVLSRKKKKNRLLAAVAFVLSVVMTLWSAAPTGLAYVDRVYRQEVTLPAEGPVDLTEETGTAGSPAEPESESEAPLIKEEETTVLPSAPESGNRDRLKEEAESLGLHTVPESEKELNIIKRARQMTDVKWTPAVDLPRYNKVSKNDTNGNSDDYRGVFRAGVEYTGLPYGKCQDTDADPNTNYPCAAYGCSDFYVGFRIPFETFITSVVNENSYLCTRAGNASSDFSLHISTVYAIVCSALASYSLGLDAPYTCVQLGGETGKALGLNTADPTDQTVAQLSASGKLNGIHLGDVLNRVDTHRGSHTVVVTDLVKNNGEIEIVEIAEATTTGEADETYAGGEEGGVCRRKGFFRDDFVKLYGAYTVLRYAGEVSYSPSKWVNVGNEIDMFRLARLPVIPFEGNRFVYDERYLPRYEIGGGITQAVKLIVNNPVVDPGTGRYRYTHVRITKDGTDATTDIAIGSEVYFSGDDRLALSPGVYHACLVRLSEGRELARTAACEWTVKAAPVKSP